MSRVEKNRLEWAVFGLGLLLVLGVVGFLVWDAALGEDSPPDLAVTLGAPERRGDGWAVPVTVRNRGQETAEGARVEVVLELPDGGREEAGFDLAFAPRGSTREGWVQFLHPPATGRLTGRVTGYEKP
ncbi:MAG TPA: hypothetical protein VKK31_05135 [Thermoanaerobaculia bacterium]|nr:hypothetical protein [Thermoanaerobaculia bacterium]